MFEFSRPLLEQTYGVVVTLAVADEIMYVPTLIVQPKIMVGEVLPLEDMICKIVSVKEA